MAIKTITLAELKDIPRLTEEQLKNAKRLRDVHPEWFEELEDLQHAIQISKEIKEGKRKTVPLEKVLEEFSSDNHDANIHI